MILEKIHQAGLSGWYEDTYDRVVDGVERDWRGGITDEERESALRALKRLRDYLQ